MPNIFPDCITMKSTCTMQTLLGMYFLIHFPHFVMHFHVVFIHILAQIGTCFLVLRWSDKEVFYLKTTTYSREKAVYFFVVFSLQNDPFSWGWCVFVDGFKRLTRSEKPSVICYFVFATWCWNFLQLPPFVSACDYAVEFSFSHFSFFFFLDEFIFSWVGDQLALKYLISGCKVFAGAELFEGICHVS